MSIEDNIKSLIPYGIKIVAVTKTVPPEKILIAIASGITDIGENYVKEAEKKFAIIGHKVRWHMIGPLQRNKVKNAVKIFDVIQTVNSCKLAEKIDKECKKINKIMDVLVQVDITNDKNGTKPEQALNLIEELTRLGNIKVRGLMSIASQKNPIADFKKMKELFDQSKLEILSMGMSNDYKEAIKEGSNMIRIGTAIFGERPKNHMV